MNFDIPNININLTMIITAIIYIIVGFVIFQIIKKFVSKLIDKRNNLKGTQLQRMKTIHTILTNFMKYCIVILVTLGVLSSFGVNVKAILTGLGIGTAIIGLAFQDLAKDIIAGFFIITENKYEIGDTIEIDGFMGEVVFLGLKTTKIRNFKGATKVVANRYMDNLINYSNNNSLAVVDISVAYESDEKKVEDTLNQLFKELNGKLEYATKDLELWGINDLSDSAVIYRVAVETKPMKQFATERQLRKEIKKAFDKAGIKIPYTQIEVHNGK